MTIRQKNSIIGYFFKVFWHFFIKYSKNGQKK